MVDAGAAYFMQNACNSVQGELWMPRQVPRVPCDQKVACSNA